MNFDINEDNHDKFHTLKSKKNKKLHSSSLHTLDKDSFENIIISFRHGIIPNKLNYSKNKNSTPEKNFIDKPKNMKSKITQSHINSILLTSIQNDKIFDNFLKKKLIKIKEKKSITSNNTNKNNSSNLSNQTIYIHNNNNNISSCLMNYLPQSNYIKKSKCKMTLDTSLKNSIYTNFKKRSISNIEDEDKNSKSPKESYLYLKNKNLSSSSSKHYVKQPFNTIQNNPNNLILKNHLKHNSLLISNIKRFSKSKYKLNIHQYNKFTFHTQYNSKKNSIDKGNLAQNLNFKSNIHLKINKGKNNLIKKEKKNDIFSEKKYNNIKYYINEKEKTFKNDIKINSNIYFKNEQSKNYSNENSEYKLRIPKNKKLTLLENLINSNKISSKKKNYQTENISLKNIKNLYQNNKIEINQKENTEKNKNDNEDKHFFPKNINIIEENSLNKNLDKNKDIDKEIKNKLINPDCDLENQENINDTLLNYINSNLDQIPNLNESNDSILSLSKENQKSIYLKDKEIISSYIKQYYNNNRKYPTTKMKFYKYGRLLGKGAFGKVNLSLHVLTGRLVAIKSINKSKIKSERHKSKIEMEKSIMKTLSSSDYIVKMFETYETKKHICIVMEYICAGDLLSYIKKRSKLSEPIAKFIFKQIILAIQFIHNHNIVHRDIKLDNILIDLDNKIKICDFGVSKRINNNEIMYEQCGTPTYIAPEILRGKGYEGYSVDIWSAGVVLYAMLSGTVPFKGNNLRELHQLILNGQYKPIVDISKEANNLLKKILEIEPKKRISINDILSHSWLNDVDIENSQKYNLFTNAERIILAKSNVDYRDINNKDDMIENFNIRNLDTNEEFENKNNNSKSIILAPFNSSITEDEDNNFEISIIDNNCNELKIQNNIIKFTSKVKEINRIYELNNNGEIDNGVVISIDSNDKKYNNNISPSPYINDSYNSKDNYKFISPHIELELNLNSAIEGKENKKEINEEALKEINKLGYSKSYIKECINNNEKNYATTSYFLLVKYCY